MRIVIFNGPPRSGKDSAAYMLAQTLSMVNRPCVMMKFSQALKDAASEILANSMTAKEHDTIGDFEDVKDAHKFKTLGITYRQLQIDISEKFMKPLYGEDVFGKIAEAQIRFHLVETDRTVDDDITFIFSDGGFDVELEHLCKAFGKENVLVVKMIRDGCTFDNDSRGYLHTSELGVQLYRIYNKESKLLLLDKVVGLAGEI